MSGTIPILPRQWRITQDEERTLASFIEIPLSRVPPDSLTGLLEEFASRDGTDYGLSETPLDERVSSLRRQLRDRSVVLLFDTESESWDILEALAAQELLRGQDVT